MPWYVYALSAAFVWGIHYNLLAKAMTTISPITAYWMPTVIMMMGIPLMWETLRSDFKATLQADPITQGAVLTIMFTSFGASVLLYKAIQSHNPVHASLIEITFPIFVATFALVLFNQNHFTWVTAVGGLLIIAGSSLIIYANG